MSTNKPRRNLFDIMRAPSEVSQFTNNPAECESDNEIENPGHVLITQNDVGGSGNCDHEDESGNVSGIKVKKMMHSGEEKKEKGDSSSNLDASIFEDSNADSSSDAMGESDDEKRRSLGTAQAQEHVGSC